MIHSANGHQLDLFEDVAGREDWVAQLDSDSKETMLPGKRVSGLFAGIGGFELGLSWMPIFQASTGTTRSAH